MKKVIVLFVVIVTALVFNSCNQWLDVKPSNEKEREDQYSTENGFRLALTGCYLKLKSTNLYGRMLTMTTVEYLAQLWETKSSDVENFMDLDWTADYSKNQMSMIFSNMYNVIYQLNDLLIQMDLCGEEVIPEKEIRYLIQGEAFALRAFCHFDILRLFGPSPVDPDKATVALPYSETASIELTPYYSYDEYVEKIRVDLLRADTLLAAVDPVRSLTFEQLNNPSQLLMNNQIRNDYQAYRQVRFNYWAVQAFKARLALYLGNRAEAYEYATSVISAVVNGSPVGDMSTFIQDVNNQWYSLPSETIFAINAYDLIDMVQNIFRSRANVLYKFETEAELREKLFDNQSSDCRLRLWTDMSYETELHIGLMKYWQQDDEENEDAMIYGQQIPIFRMAEMYLIAAETAPTLVDGNRFLDEFRRDRGLPTIECTTFGQLKGEILKEYLKEFYAEGQMFFTYKRMGATEMIWNENRKINISEYRVPLPETEYENQ